MNTDTLKALQGSFLLMMGYTFYPVSNCFWAGNYSKALWMAVPLAIITGLFHWVTAELRRREQQGSPRQKTA
jgi:hypothetical protein